MKNFDYLLFFKWLLLNITGAGFLVVSFLFGWVDMVLAGDPFGIVILIFCVFVFGLLLSGTKIFHVSKEINYLKREPGAEKWKAYDSDEGLQLKLFGKNVILKYISNTLVLLGLIGTVVGFIYVSTNIPAEIVGNVEVLAEVVSVLVKGLGVAFYTTLVGSILGLWTSFNYALLLQGTAYLLSEIYEARAKE